VHTACRAAPDSTHQKPRPPVPEAATALGQGRVVPPAAAVPRMELPPLSPGIQASVMDDAEVLETVRRGWSGGTAEEGKAHEHLTRTG